MSPISFLGVLLIVAISSSFGEPRPPRSNENDFVIELNSRWSQNNSDRSKRQVIIQKGGLYRARWPDATVNYYFDERRFDPRVEESVLRAMDKISNQTCVRFTTEPADIMIRMISRSSGSCHSVIGRMIDDQEFMFNDDCYSVGQAVHELTHALGFIHAHQRKDRDEYLDIDMDKYWDTDEEDQYRIFKRQKLFVPYDYGSIMQYYGTVQEFTAKKPEFQYTMGSETVSFYDYLMINKYYQCSCPSPLKCENSGYANPANCSRCNCPYGFGGDDCARRAEPGETVQATGSWQQVNVTLDAGFRKHNGQKDRQIDYVFHYLWITAPENQTIEIRVDDFSGVECREGCVRGGFEVKTLKDPRMTSPRQCCDEGKKVFRSENNPTVVQVYNVEGLDTYGFSYRFVD